MKGNPLSPSLPREGRGRRRPLLAVLVLLMAGAAGARGQLAVRPDDPMGLSIRERRVQALHSDTPDLPGASMHLQQTDPWLAYQRGRSYFFREWGSEDGVFQSLPRRPEAASVTSCGMCHNLPFPSTGAGGNVATPVGTGRTAPHLFGGGLLETIGLQIRRQILAEHDANRNGYLDAPAETRGERVVIEATPGVLLDFGALDDGDGNGWPDLDRALMVRMVDQRGRRLLFRPDGRIVRLDDPDVVGYDLTVGVFASSAGDHQFPSMRSFAMGAFNTIMGLLVDVPVEASHRPGFFRVEQWGEISNAGSFQSDVFLTSDPARDRDSRLRGTVSVGELDLLEWYLLNHPAPAKGKQDQRTRRGRELLGSMGCTSCHVASWAIRPADERLGLPGDRRFFHLAVAHDPATGRLEGRLQRLTRTVERPDGSALVLPRRAGFLVEDLFTDLRHHDMGDRFYEYNYWKGELQFTKRFRTAPLWGVGSTAPYGHDGMSPTLDDVIRRHGGEAAAAAAAYAAAPEADREAVLAFLRSLVLYQPEMLPTDLDGDGKIAAEHQVAGLPAGPERFRPELFFRVPPRYRGWIEEPDGERWFSYELHNVAEAYGERLPALLDADLDGVPDLAQAAGGARAAH